MRRSSSVRTLVSLVCTVLGVIMISSCATVGSRPTQAVAPPVIHGKWDTLVLVDWVGQNPRAFGVFTTNGTVNSDGLNNGQILSLVAADKTATQPFLFTPPATDLQWYDHVTEVLVKTTQDGVTRVRYVFEVEGLKITVFAKEIRSGVPLCGGGVCSKVLYLANLTDRPILCEGDPRDRSSQSITCDDLKRGAAKPSEVIRGSWSQ